MKTDEYQFLKTIEFKYFNTWAVKNYLRKQVKSKYLIERIANITVNQTKKNVLLHYPDVKYGILGISNERGMFDAYEEFGEKINQPYKFVKDGFLAYNPYRINVGSIGIKTSSLNFSYISPAYVVFSCKESLIPEYLYILMCSKKFNRQIRESTTGSVRQTLSYESLSAISIPLPTLLEQEKIVSKYENTIKKADDCEEKANKLEASIDAILFEDLGIEEIKASSDTAGGYNMLKFNEYKNICQWGVDKNINKLPYCFTTYKSNSFLQNNALFQLLIRGKSPKYSESSNVMILNQKCNRWDELDLDYAKKVDEEWLSSIDKNVLTRIGDIIINSTREGTLGRSSLIKDENHEKFLYDSHMLLLRLNMDIVDPQFFVYLFNSNFGQKQVELFKGAQATKQTELGVENVKKMIFPLPEYEKQLEIAKKITVIKAQIKELRQEASHLHNKAKQDFQTEVFSE